MAETVASLAVKAREDSGQANAKEITDATVQRYIQDAIDLASRYAPNRAMYSITLVEDTQDYAVATGIVSVLDVYAFSSTAVAQVFGDEFDLLIGRDLDYGWEMSQYNKFVSSVK